MYGTDDLPMPSVSATYLTAEVLSWLALLLAALLTVAMTAGVAR